MTTSIKEMREWIEGEIADDMAWIQNNKNLKLTGTERREKRLVMYRAILAALEERVEGPSEAEKKEMLIAIDELREMASCFMAGPDFGKGGVVGKIRALIASNQGGAVSPDTWVSPHGETSGAVKDIAKWAERIHADANLGVMHVQHLLEEMLREAGVAGKEEK